MKISKELASQGVQYLGSKLSTGSKRNPVITPMVQEYKGLAKLKLVESNDKTDFAKVVSIELTETNIKSLVKDLQAILKVLKTFKTVEEVKVVKKSSKSDLEKTLEGLNLEELRSLILSSTKK